VAEAIDAENWDRVAPELFDRLRLREPLAQAFHALGLEGESGCRGAARVKALLLTQCGAPMQARDDSGKAAPESGAEAAEMKPARKPPDVKAQPAAYALLVPPGLWEDPDICWLTGAHMAGDHTYLVREPYEELLWWLALPRLLRLAESAEPHRADAAIILDDINKALVTLEGAGYRLDQLLEPDTTSTREPAHRPQNEALETVPKTGPQAGPDPEELEPQEPIAAKPVGPKDPEGPPEEY
jgi:hypothetical protein